MKRTNIVLSIVAMSLFGITLFTQPVEAAPPQCFIVGNAVDADGNVLNTTAYIPAPASCVDHSASYAFTDFDPSWDPTTHFQDNECYVFSSPFTPPQPFNSWNDDADPSCVEVADTQTYLGQLTDLETFFDDCEAANGITIYDQGTYSCVDGLGNPIEDISPTQSPLYNPNDDEDPDDYDFICEDGTEGIQLSNGGCEPFSEETATQDFTKNPIFSQLGILVNFLLGGVGLGIVAGFVYAGYQYIFSGGNAQITKSAKKNMTLATIALIMYVFSWALINWLVPGGILN